MKKPLTNEEIRERIEKGQIKTRIIFELVGKPKEHIETTIRAYLGDVESKSEAYIIDKEFSEAKEQENGFYSIICDAEILVEDFQTLVDFCFEYMPASIEIEEPETLQMSNVDFMSMFNDLLFRLHEVSLELKKSLGKQKFAEENSVKLIYNLILLSLKEKDKTIDEIFEDTRLNKEDLKEFLNKLISMNMIKEENNKYSANIKKEINENNKNEVKD